MKIEFKKEKSDEEMKKRRRGMQKRRKTGSGKENHGTRGQDLG
jgi:hypothetical protein